MKNIETKLVDTNKFRVAHESMVYAWKAAWKSKEADIHQIAEDHGWWNEEKSSEEIIAIIHSKLSEALKAMKNEYQKSENIPDFSNVEEDLADVVIHIMEYSHHIGLNISDAINAKTEYNRNRPT